ncbi:MAG: hypothetical protein HRU47_04825 [Verrucomicrobiales bacterium]|nr:hypothetical protein [Verrucomicrobiales bacterium]
MNILTYPILACATCMSSRGEATTEAAGMAILLMLIILAGVFGGIFKFMRYLSRCERKAVGRR